MSDIENPNPEPNQAPNQNNPPDQENNGTDWCNCSDQTFEYIGSCIRFSMVILFLLWVFLAGYFYYQDKYTNIHEVTGKIISDFTFQNDKTYDIIYEFRPHNRDEKIRGVFHETMHTANDVIEANLYWSKDNEIQIYYRESNPKINDINRYSIVKADHIANIIFSVIIAIFLGPTCLIFTFVKLENDPNGYDTHCVCRYHPCRQICCT